MISTYHGDETRKIKAKRGQEKEKLISVLDYNQNMGGVYLKNQLLHTYLLERKKNDKMVYQNVQEIAECHNSEFYDNI
jgi:hypothetical protein